MNVLFLSLAYHPSAVNAVASQSRDGLQNQINSYQWAFLEGIVRNLTGNEQLSVVNSLPVGVFPTRYRKLVLRSHTYPERFREVGSLNLPWFKQHTRAVRARREIERWIAASPDNRTVLLYTLYLPYLQAVAAVKLKHPEVSVCAIVTDLPNELGISSGRKGLLRKLEYARGSQSLALCEQLDGFVLLTEPMADALHVGERPFLVMEGLISDPPPSTEGDVETPNDPRPAVLYTGTLNRELGIGAMLEAFQQMPEAQLWLCGRGDMEADIVATAKACESIRYFGFVTQNTALALQSKADALINPRTAQGAYTRYSFPSKTLEYMRSGKPVLCCKLEGIPGEYDPFLRYMEPQNAQGIVTAVRDLMRLPKPEREAIGNRARIFVTVQKNSLAQCAKLVGFLRGLGRP
ncbi:MAG TPA: glycosyltransferase [Candidatus Limiplasma sp.]|nr:glycosyltransferase [Candidatus Limiplasma sp.]